MADPQTPQPKWRPWPTFGMSWLFALIVAIIGVLGLVHAIEINALIVQVEIILLALALLL